MILLESNQTNPFYNLALEQYIFDEMDKTKEYCYLWQNANTIVVGKYQNTLREINASFIREKGIRVVRRLSGGGAVYHDLGNLNFTFITSAGGRNIDFARFCQPVVEALGSMGVQAQMSGRNDMVIEGKKFSGNAQYIKNGRVMHHGTLLYNSDLQVLGQALKVQKDKIESKGVASVRSRVTNIIEAMPQNESLEEFRKRLKQGLFAREQVEEYNLSDRDAAKVEEIQKKRYETWEWNFGGSPPGSVVKSRRIEGCGGIQLYLIENKGRIQSVKIYGDFFSGSGVEALENLLLGARLERLELERLLAGVQLDGYIARVQKDAFIDLLLE